MITGTLILILWFAYWSAESGGSLPWSSTWQDKKGWYSEVPEAIVALSVGFIAAWGWDRLLDIPFLYTFVGLVIAVLVAYAGKQSGTWAYLRWQSHKDPNTARTSTLKPFNDFVGKLFGYRLGDEGYSWIWAATKGFIMTLPILGLGIVFHPLGHELGSHAKGRTKSPNTWKELAGGGIGIGVPAAIFIFSVIKLTQ